MIYTGERLIPKTGLGNIEEHLLFYKYSKFFIRNTDVVLDIACGSGWGTALLAEKASSVEGVDISEEAVAYAQNEYLKKEGCNYQYRQGSILDIPFYDETFDVVVSIETFEHVEYSDITQLIKECFRVLKKGGLFIFSTPNGDLLPYQPKSPEEYQGWHKYHYKVSEIRDLLSIFKEIKIEGIYGNLFIVCEKN